MNWTERGSKLGSALVLVLAVCLLVFAIYLKASPALQPQSPHSSGTQVKMWADPDQSLDRYVKFAPFVFILFFFLGLIALRVHPVDSALVSGEALPDLFSRLPNRFRPPPHI
jgi:hypothetical protein